MQDKGTQTGDKRQHRGNQTGDKRQDKGNQTGDKTRISNIVETIIKIITPITITYATIIDAAPLTNASINGRSPAIELFQKTSIIISPTIHNGQKINTNGKNRTVRTT